MSALQDRLHDFKTLALRLEVKTEGGHEKVTLGWDPKGAPINPFRCMPSIKDEDVRAELEKLIKALFEQS